jgi:uncharacterized protein (TIGR02284 family)
MAANDRFTTSDNRDPITDEPGAHPVGTGIGATGGALAGAAAGTLGGPIGMAVGGVAGAVVGGLAGKAAAESVNPTAEEAYWRNNYTRETYYEAGRTYSDYGPAYELGWSYRARYGDDFDNCESKLASDWENQRGVSKLSWPQARSASRAAWDRVDNKLSGVNLDKNDDTGNDEAVDTLNDVIETCHDGEYGFKACAEHASAIELKTLFRQRAEQCSDAAAELRGHVLRLGGEPETRGSASGAMHRGWVAVRGTLSGYSDQAVLDECERGEDAAVARYRKALKTGLPSDLRVVLERQLEGAQTSHGQIKTLRDQQRARA